MAGKKKKEKEGPIFSIPYKCGHCDNIVPFKHLPHEDPNKDAWQCTTPGCLFTYKSKYRKLRKKGSKKSEEFIPVEKPQDLSILEQISTV